MWSASSVRRIRVTDSSSFCLQYGSSYAPRQIFSWYLSLPFEIRTKCGAWDNALYCIGKNNCCQIGSWCKQWIFRIYQRLNHKANCKHDNTTIGLFLSRWFARQSCDTWNLLKLQRPCQQIITWGKQGHVRAPVCASLNCISYTTVGKIWIRFFATHLKFDRLRYETMIY